MAAVVLRGVEKRFGKIDVIRGVDLDIETGEFVVFVGPSGCGKSTLLRLIAGLEEATGGDIVIGGRRVNDVAPADRGVAMVFQSYALYPHMTAYENMAFGLKLKGGGKQDVDRAVREAARILQVEHLLDRKPKEMSGGQRQRIAIGRAIVRRPQVFLFDEPLSNLDAALRVQTRIEIARLHRSMEATMVYVTHDQVEAMTLADRIVVLNRGRVEQVGSPLELYHTPANRFVAGFIGSPSMNFLDTRALGAEDGAVVVSLPDGQPCPVPADGARGAAPGRSLVLGVRPEHLSLDGPGLAVPGKATLVEQLGESTLVHVTAGGAPILVRQEGTVHVREGADVRVRVRPEACHLFDPESGAAVPRGGRRAAAARTMHAAS
jgi:multiple sugar transport system ATP-binding protein